MNLKKRNLKFHYLGVFFINSNVGLRGPWWNGDVCRPLSKLADMVSASSLNWNFPAIAGGGLCPLQSCSCMRAPFEDLIKTSGVCIILSAGLSRHAGGLSFRPPLYPGMMSRLPLNFRPFPWNNVHMESTLNTIYKKLQQKGRAW